MALRSAGYNHVDLAAAARLRLPVVRVPAYSPYAVAEHAVGLLLALNQKIHRAYARVREWNFSLVGLVGFDLALSVMKRGSMVINTGRGALIDSRALIAALKTGQVGAAGRDVYEEEEGVFFRDLSDKVLQDDVLARLLSFPNVLVTSRQAFLTREALANIASTTLANVAAFECGEALANEVRAEEVLR